jgi:predicted nucleic acid-binding protein
LANIYLLDSDIITFLSERNFVAEQNVKAAQQEDEIVTYFIVTAEWELGILTAHGRRRQQEIRAKGEPVLRSLSRVLQSSEEVSLEYAQISAELRKAGTMIPLHDIWIAAVARVYGATVVTHDKHYRHVHNLAVVDWTVLDESEPES